MPHAADARWHVHTDTLGAALTTHDLATLTVDDTFLAEAQRLLDVHGVLHLASSTPVTLGALTALAHHLGHPHQLPEPAPRALPGSTFVRDLSAAARVDTSASPPPYIETLHYDSAGPRPAAYSVLHTREVPATIAPQVWIDMAAVHAALPDTLRSLVTARWAVHGALPAPTAPLDHAPPFDPRTNSRRPLTAEHWRTGKPVLYLPKHPHSTIEGLPDDEGRAVLADLWARTAASPSRLATTMRSNDVVVWDNLRVVHTNPPYPRERDRTVWFFVIPGDHRLKPAPETAASDPSDEPGKSTTPGGPAAGALVGSADS